MQHPTRTNSWVKPAAALAAAAGLALVCGAATAAPAEAAKTPYPAMAPMEQYRFASQAEEVALARSAAPPSISDKAEVLVLGARGYETAAKGTNGFACIVERGWANNPDNAEFWSPKVRAPICFNAASASTVLPTYLKRTEWVLAGASSAEVTQRTEAAVARGEIVPPSPGSMCFMMAKDGYLGDAASGHWRPHLMFFVPRVDLASWGARLPGSPVMGDDGGVEPYTVFYVPVQQWSDGTPGPMAHAM